MIDPKSLRQLWSDKRQLFRLLPLTIGLLVIAGLAKSAGMIDVAIAQDAAAVPGHAALRPAPAPKVPVRRTTMDVTNWSDRSPPPPLCKPNLFSETGERKTLLELRHREAALDSRSRMLDREQQELDATKLALSRQIAAFKPLATRLEALESAQTVTDNARWHGLVATYSAMAPRDAARIFDGLDADVVINVLRRMNSRQAAPILASMAPDKARSITEKLAGMPTKSADLANAAALLPDGAP